MRVIRMGRATTPRQQPRKWVLEDVADDKVTRDAIKKHEALLLTNLSTWLLHVIQDQWGVAEGRGARHTTGDTEQGLTPAQQTAGTQRSWRCTQPKMSLALQRTESSGSVAGVGGTEATETSAWEREIWAAGEHMPTEMEKKKNAGGEGSEGHVWYCVTCLGRAGSSESTVNVHRAEPFVNLTFMAQPPQ